MRCLLQNAMFTTKWDAYCKMWHYNAHIIPLTVKERILFLKKPSFREGLEFNCLVTNNLYAFFSIKNAFFSTQSQCSLTCSWTEHQMLLRCYLIHINIIILRQILYSAYLCPCLDLGLFMLYLCDLFFILSLIFIVINHITSLKQTHLFFVA